MMEWNWVESHIKTAFGAHLKLALRAATIWHRCTLCDTCPLTLRSAPLLQQIMQLQPGQIAQGQDNQKESSQVGKAVRQIRLKSQLEHYWGPDDTKRRAKKKNVSEYRIRSKEHQIRPEERLRTHTMDPLSNTTAYYVFSSQLSWT